MKLVNFYGAAEILSITCSGWTALPGMMCRFQLSVSWDGILYDCDFNQAIDLKVNGVSNIKDLGDKLECREIAFGEHCYACTAGAGSSCGGATT